MHCTARYLSPFALVVPVAMSHTDGKAQSTSAGVHGYSLGVDKDATTAFRVFAPGNGGIATYTIDNPMTNGDPSAILIVTRTHSGSDATNRQLYPFTVFYDTGVAKWRIKYDVRSVLPGGTYYPPNTYFNVLVIKN